MEGETMMNVSMLDFFYSVIILALFIRIFWNAINRTHQLSHDFKKLVNLEKELETRDLNQAELEELGKELQKHKRKSK
jgi:hypothetical protein